MDLSRFRIAVEGGSIVGISGSFALDLTVPGGAALPMGGVTWVSVAATHRRQGVLRRLLAEIHADIDAREEPVAGLSASEGGIYGRFGYGVASQMRRVSIDTRAAQLRDELTPKPGSVRFLEAPEARVHGAGALGSVPRARRRARRAAARRGGTWSSPTRPRASTGSRPRSASGTRTATPPTGSARGGTRARRPTSST